MFRLSITLILLAMSTFAVSSVSAQLPPPDKKQVFIGDLPAVIDQQKKIVQDATRPDKAPNTNLDFQAPEIEFRRDSSQIFGKGGILVSEGGVQVQADEGVFEVDTRQGQVKGNVVVTTPDATFQADAANLNINSETGEFENVDFTVEQGNYHVEADHAYKMSEFEFQLKGSDMTTCHCPDGARPWVISSSKCNITQEGYAHSTNTTIYFEGVPILYSPYFVFPVKTQRASGLLSPVFGTSNQNGFQFIQPVFFVLNDSSDITVTPFIQTATRVGSSVEYRQLFTSSSKVDTRFYYSNESRRGSSLRGLNVSNYVDPEIDTDRTGGFFSGQWQPDQRENLPVSLIADGHWTSDNLFVKEIDDSQVGPKESQYLVSTAVARGVFFEKINAEMRTEYNEVLYTDPQEYQLQRVPEVNVGTTYTMRPFGFNPYGLKLVSTTNASGTEFVRQSGYDGFRGQMRPQLAVPFHISNYVRGQATAQVLRTEYRLNDNTIPANQTPLPDGSTTLDSSSSLTVPALGYGMSTGVERIYDLDRGNWFSDLVNLGADNSGRELVRLKHTIEPNFQYNWIPEADQGSLPLFDTADRARQRSLFTYGFTSRLYGKNVRPYEQSRDVEELAPSGKNLPTFDMSSALLDFDRNVILPKAPGIDPRQGEVRELVTFSLKQNYDWIEAQKNLDPIRGPYSDVNVGLSLQPSNYFGFALGGDVRTADKNFSRYDAAIGMRDDHEDVLRLRYSYIDVNGETVTAPDGTATTSSPHEVTANAEYKISERLRLGYYARYSFQISQMIESRGLIRFTNACRCWSVDLGFSDQLNPDQQNVLVTFTFAGLGDITQNVGYQRNAPQQQN